MTTDKKNCVLIVDDDKDFLHQLALAFNEQMPESAIFVADNAKDALKLLTTYSISLMVSDIQMPLMDGVELMLLCRRFQGNLKVFLMTHEPLLYWRDGQATQATAIFEKQRDIPELLRSAQLLLS